jgi:TatD DNase family protein
MNIIDTHAHLDHVASLDMVLKNADTAGVSGIVAVSSDLASMRKIQAIAGQCHKPKIYPAYGIHPGNIQAEEVEEAIVFIRKNISGACAVGEIGLDFWYKWVRKDQLKKDEQRRVFQRQLELAAEFDKPAIIHTRGTWAECLASTKTAGVKCAVFHWYSGPLDVLDGILAAGYYVSASPSLAQSPQSREAIAHAPLERTLIETDSPVFYRDREGDGGFTAEPKDVFRTLKAYCELKNLDEQTALTRLNTNARELFQLK